MPPPLSSTRAAAPAGAVTWHNPWLQHLEQERGEAGEAGEEADEELALTSRLLPRVRVQQARSPAAGSGGGGPGSPLSPGSAPLVLHIPSASSSAASLPRLLSSALGRLQPQRQQHSGRLASGPLQQRLPAFPQYTPPPPPPPPPLAHNPLAPRDEPGSGSEPLRSPRLPLSSAGSPSSAATSASLPWAWQQRRRQQPPQRPHSGSPQMPGGWRLSPPSSQASSVAGAQRWQLQHSHHSFTTVPLGQPGSRSGPLPRSQQLRPPQLPLGQPSPPGSPYAAAIILQPCSNPPSGVATPQQLSAALPHLPSPPTHHPPASPGAQQRPGSAGSHHSGASAPHPPALPPWRTPSASLRASGASLARLSLTTPALAHTHAAQAHSPTALHRGLYSIPFSSSQLPVSTLAVLQEARHSGALSMLSSDNSGPLLL
jgi:hypothetical protein